MSIRILNLFICLNFIFSPTYAFGEGISTGEVIGIGLDALQNISQQQQAQQAQLLQAQKMQHIQSVLSAETYPNDIFPNCLNLSAHVPEMSEEMCKAPPSNFIQAQEYDNYKNIAFTLADQYSAWAREHSELRSIGNQEFKNPHAVGMNQKKMGYQCLANSKKDLQQVLDKRISDLQKLRDDMSQATQQFKTELEAKTLALKEYQGLLSGGDGFQLNSNSRIYSDFFKNVINDPTCKTMFSDEKIKKDSSKGLRGILGELDKVRTSKDGKNLADELVNNYAKYKKDIEDMAQKMSTSINRVGVDQALGDSNKIRGLSSLGFNNSDSFKYAYQSAVQNINEEIGLLKTKLKSRGIKISENDVFKFGRTDFEEKIRRFKMEQEDLCIKSKFGFSKSDSNWLKEVFPGMRDTQRGRNKRSSASSNMKFYQQALSQVLENDSLNIDTKLAKLKNIDSRSDKDLKVLDMDTEEATKAGNKFVRFSELYKKRYDACQSDLANSRVLYSSKNGKISSGDHEEGLSMSDTIAEARAIHQEFKNIEQTAAPSIKAAITDRLIECKDSGTELAYSNSPSNCNQDKLSMDHGSFCLAQSVQCAQKAQTCGNNLNSSIEAIVGNMKMEAEASNRAVRDFISKQVNQFKLLKNDYLLASNNLKSHFRHDIPIEIPKGMTFDFPFAELDKVNGIEDVALINPEKAFDRFNENLDKLESSVKAQNTAVLASAQSEIDKWQNIWKEQANRWKGIRDTCQGQVMAFNQGVAEANKKKETDQKKLDQELARACFNIQRASQPGNTAGGDDVSSLNDDLYVIMQRTGNYDLANGYSGCNNNNGSKELLPIQIRAKATAICKKGAEGDLKYYCDVLNGEDSIVSKSTEQIGDQVITKYDQSDINQAAKLIVKSQEEPNVGECSFEIPAGCPGGNINGDGAAGTLEGIIKEVSKRGIATGNN